MFFKFKGRSKKSHLFFKDNYGYKSFCGLHVRVNAKNLQENQELDKKYPCSCFVCRKAYEKAISLNQKRVYKKVIIKVSETKDRRPINFIFNDSLYIVKDSVMGSFQPTPGGNKGFRTRCVVEGQNHEVIIWLNGDEWFVEY